MRRSANPISVTRESGRHGAAHPADRLGTRQWRHLRQPSAGAGDDLRIDRSHQLRPGRDGHVQRLCVLADDAMGSELLDRVAARRARLVLRRCGHPADDPAAAAQRSGAVRGGGVHRNAHDLPFAGRRHLELHDQRISLAVSQGGFRRLGISRLASGRHDPGYAPAAGRAVRLLPFHTARPGDASGSAESGLGPPGRCSGRLDAGARLGTGGRGWGGRGNHGSAGRLSGAQYDGEHTALRICQCPGGRYLQSGRGRRRRLHRGGARELDRLFRQPAGKNIRTSI